jgi:hypothetical protein
MVGLGSTTSKWQASVSDCIAASISDCIERGQLLHWERTHRLAELLLLLLAQLLPGRQVNGLWPTAAVRVAVKVGPFTVGHPK